MSESKVNTSGGGSVRIPPESPVPDPGHPAAAGELTPMEELAKLRGEYSELQERYGKLRRRGILEDVCRETGCIDPEYLEFRAARAGVDIENAAALKKFAGELSSASPGCFSARITPGSSAGAALSVSAPAEGVPAGASPGDRIGMIALSVSAAPDAYSR